MNPTELAESLARAGLLMRHRPIFNISWGAYGAAMRSYSR